MAKPVANLILVTAVLMGSASRTFGEQIAFELRLYNHANAPASALNEATRRLQAIYRRVGIDTIRPGVDASKQGLIITVHVMDGSSIEGNPETVLGAAVESHQGCGRIAYVYWDRIQDFALEHRASPAVVLTVALAHEVGHLLLPPNSHTAAGVMQATLTTTEFRLASASQLHFSAKEGERMRRRIIEDSTGQTPK